YGFVQANAPRLLRAKDRSEAQIVDSARFWVGTLFVVPALLALALYLVQQPTVWLTTSVVLGLLVFGALFAINSSLHSYLILAFTSSKRVTMDVGFYYMANAAGRLFGTVLSGLSYQFGGVALCLACAAAMIACSWLSISNLDSQKAQSSFAE
ncbi:MAG: MFS transporter, partial [Pseudomonadota bacterium]